MLIVLVVIPALCLWAGYGLFQLVGPRELRLEIPPGLFLFGLTGALALGWIALILAEVGLFSAPVMAAISLCLGALGELAARRRGPRVRLIGLGLSPALRVYLVGLLALMGLLYLRPHEFIFGGADAGVYVNLGSQVARSGRWLIYNSDLSQLAPADYPMLFREQPPPQIPRYVYLPGFYVTDGNAGVIIPQFYPLHPIWLAIAHGLGGVQANLLMTPMWGILGVVAVFFAARETFDERLAAIAAGLLALTPTQIWFARYPTAEALTQFLLFGGLYAFARYVRYGEKWAAILAGLALGQVMLVRADTYFLLGALVVYAAYLRLKQRLDRQFWHLALPMLAMAAHSLFHAVWQGWPYLHNSYLPGTALLPPPSLLLAGGLALAIAYGVVERVVARRPDWEARVQPAWRLLLNAAAIGLVLLALYAYFLLPLRADPARQFYYWYGEHAIPDVEPCNFVRLGWYLSPLGVALGVLGLAWIVRQQFSERTWLLVGIGIFFSILFTYRTFNNPHHIYVMRRYVPAAIPAFAIGIAYVLQRFAAWRPIGRVVAAGLALAQVGLLLYADRAVARQVDYQGGLGQYSAFSGSIPRDAIVVFNDDQPVGTAGIVGTPLAYLDGHTVIDLQEKLINRDRLDALMQSGLASGRPVVMVEGPSKVAGLRDRWQCRSLGAVRFDLPVLEASYYHFPVKIERMQFSLDLYQVESLGSIR